MNIIFKYMLFLIASFHIDWIGQFLYTLNDQLGHRFIKKVGFASLKLIFNVIKVFVIFYKMIFME